MLLQKMEKIVAQDETVDEGHGVVRPMSEQVDEISQGLEKVET